MRGVADRFPLVGPLVWVSCVQYFIVQLVVASAWDPAYSWRLNSISDLGATHCGEFDGRLVCSPWHGLMNVSFVFLGLAMAVGAVLIAQVLGDSRASRAGFALMAVAGVGAIIVGFFPENGIYGVHLAGADLAFLLGNVALVVFGLSLRVPTWLRWYSVVSGVVALVALVLFLVHHRLFLGLGGMERVVAYPQTIWLIVVGSYLVVRRTQLEAVPADATA
ncbi:MAG: DUF998 domain-containing protein [Promicromonosporaceae bacterium]|nr:DUF998 domain-containing protein [Promicromonosporaceae bacterium]